LRMSHRWLRLFRWAALGPLRLVIRASGLGLARERFEEWRMAWKYLINHGITTRLRNITLDSIYYWINSNID
jgi:hypothetical protein